MRTFRNINYGPNPSGDYLPCKNGDILNFSEEDLNEFKAEMFEILDSCEKHLLGITPQSNMLAVFEVVSRGLHNLKGGVGLMGYTKLERHIHELENIFITFK